MSKTVDELHEIFKDEQRALYFRAITTGDTLSLVESERAAIRAVVRALRDEILDETEPARIECCGKPQPTYPIGEPECCCAPDIYFHRDQFAKLFDEILGDAGGKAAGQDTAKPEAIERSTPATDPDPRQSDYTEYMNETLPMKTANPAQPANLLAFYIPDDWCWCGRRIADTEAK